MSDLVQRLRNFCVWNARHSHYDPVPVCQEGAAEIERLRIEREEMRKSRMEECEFVRASCASQIRALRDALKPFAEYYDDLERNGYLNGFDLISRQDGRILGHAGIQADALKAAHEALTQQERKLP